MTIHADRKTHYRHTLFAAALAASLGVSGTVIAASDSAMDPTPHSDGIGAAISDTAIAR